MAKNITTPDATALSNFIALANAFKVPVDLNQRGISFRIAAALAPFTRQMGISTESMPDYVKLTPAMFFKAVAMRISDSEAYITNKARTAFVGFVKGAIVVDVTKSISPTYTPEGAFFINEGFAFCSFFMNGLAPKTLDIDISHWRNGEGKPLNHSITIERDGITAI